MRYLPDALLTAQQEAPFRLPHVRVRISEKRAGVHHPTWASLYSDATPVGPHDAFAASVDDLFQLRIDLADDKLYRRHLTSPHDYNDTILLGVDSVGDSNLAVYANLCIVFAVTVTQPTELDDMTIHCRREATAVAKAVIYTDNAGEPDDLVAASTERSNLPTVTAAWETFVFAAPVVLQPGTYWFGIHAGTASVYVTSFTAAGAARWYVVVTYASGPPDPFGVPEPATSRNFSIHAHGWTPHPWTDWGVTAHACAVAGHDLNLVAVYIANGSPFHVFYATSGNGGATWSGWTDTGMVSDTNGRVAVALKDTSNYAIFYTRGAQLYVRELRAGSWQAEDSSAYTFTSITGIDAVYSIDYNLAITGEDASAKPGVWSAIFGNGFNEPLGDWSLINEVIIRGSTEDFTYLDPHLARRDSFELTFIENHTGTTASYIAMHTHTTLFTDFASSPFREPVPMNYPHAYGPAMCFAGTYEWNCTPDTITEASSSTAYWDITSDVVDVTHHLIPGSFRSKLIVVLDNTAGKFNSFARLGDEIVVELGYETNSGILYSATPPC